jgi:hypothetical protein
VGIRTKTDELTHVAVQQLVQQVLLPYVKGLQGIQIAEIMQQNAVRTCLDGAPATMAEHAASICLKQQVPSVQQAQL